MNREPITMKQKIFGVLINLPFLFAVIFLIIGLFSLDDKYLQERFSISFIVITIIALVHLSFILILVRVYKFDFELPQTLVKKVLSVVGLSFLLILSSGLLEMGLRMNLNNWLKDDNLKQLELIVIDKYVSVGRATDYYVIFDSTEGRLKNKVGGNSYDNFSLGELYQATVKEGYFDGYFLTKSLERKNK